MKKFLSIVLVLWTAIAIFNTIYNIDKIFSEIHQWAPLSASQKRHLLFGDLYDFIVFLQKNTTSKDHVLIYAKDARMIHLGIYFMYPEYVVSTRYPEDFTKNLQTKNFNYVAIYDANVTVVGFKKVVVFKSKTSNVFGVLYKKI